MASGINYGDVVSLGTVDVVTQNGITIKQLVLSSKAYDGTVIGVVSNNYNEFLQLVMLSMLPTILYLSL